MTRVFATYSLVFLLLLSVIPLTGAQVTPNARDSFTTSPDVLIRDLAIEESLISGEIVNTGSRTLTRARMVIFFLNEQGKPVYEKPFYPLEHDQSVSIQIPHKDDEIILKPGYAKRFLVDISDVPRSWKGNIDIVLTEVTYKLDHMQ